MSEPVCVDTCRELLPFYLNGSLEAAEAEAVSTHLASCPECARDLDELSEIAVAIERHGAAASRAIRSPVRVEMGLRSRLLLIAAALVPLIAGAAWAWFVLRGGHVAPGISGGAAAPAEVVVFDLAGGPTRDQAAPPILEIPRGTARVRFVFFVPVSPGAVYAAEIRDATGRVMIPERTLGPLDALGRASLEAPAAGLVTEGSYELVASRAGPGNDRTTYQFTFVVRRFAQQGATHD
ncbi:MAG TPA: zf-HC2 domain-containing protein [Patescibacteria group bacterium]|nr:zf-HC2 domain-containing protein [Patescibacteria group bacterium]